MILTQSPGCFVACQAKSAWHKDTARHKQLL